MLWQSSKASPILSKTTDCIYPRTTWVGCPESLMVHFRVGGTQDCILGHFSAVPTGLDRFSNLYPGLTSWATLSRPYGTQFGSHADTCSQSPYSTARLKACP